MEALPEDELLVRQREKLLVNTAWIQRQQRRMHSTDGCAYNAAGAEYNTPDSAVIRRESATPYAGEEERSLGCAGDDMKAWLTSPAARQPSVGNATWLSPSRQLGTNSRIPGAVRSSVKRGDSHKSVRGGYILGVQERSALWQLRREQKIEEQRVLHAEDYSQCTFSPTIHGLPENMSGFAALEAPGVEQFLQRQARARELACVREERGRTSGDKWACRFTVTEPFVFGRRQTVESLRPPIENVPGTTRELLSEGEKELRSGGGRTAHVDSRESLLSTTPLSLEALAAEASVSLPPPGAFSSWTMLYSGGKQPSVGKTGDSGTVSQ
ncbi:hypothetical protein TRSC58_00384 [Trypanosoma rangeli SC58]|uniref:Uncharacterized protein n=1 Tax=Trypanosoma rangeli SC58 TaxID=429131 RepID=A0A061JEB6_TRYRA|nr:hypothetical protein TRSC58_00384 [Trypanosoma rangeli SC58]